MTPSEYINRTLEQVKNTVQSPFGQYRGYSVGTITYRRKDGLSIQEEDLFNLRKLSYGQIHIVRGEPGQDVCSVFFECDSTD
jgi:hypothetical protein